MNKLSGPIARAEISRRANNRAHKHDPNFVREPAGPEVEALVKSLGRGITGAELQAWAGKNKPARKSAPAPKPAPAEKALTSAQVAWRNEFNRVLPLGGLKAAHKAAAAAARQAA